MRTIATVFLTITLLGIFLTLPVAEAVGQASDISFEKVKEKCKDIPREERLRIAVTRFSVSSNAARATNQLGEELTAILTNALQQSSCFRVLESTRNKADLEDEIRYNESGATDGSGPLYGQQLGAQAIVTAEITEYSEGNQSIGALGVSVGRNKAKVGLIVKVLDPQTRDVLWSRSVNGEAKKNGFNGMKFLGVGVAGSTNVSEAMSAAVEDVILRTVDVLVKEREIIEKEFPAVEVPSGNWTVVTVSNVNYSKLNGLVASLKSSPNVKDVQKELSGSKGTVRLLHEGSSDDIAEMIDSQLNGQFEITGVQNGAITLQAK